MYYRHDGVPDLKDLEIEPYPYELQEQSFPACLEQLSGTPVTPGNS
jgi:hypothetical protein